jgi:branched-chain amino acid transport system substrate-binding protein
MQRVPFKPNRRDLLAGTAAAVTTLAAPSVLRAEQAPLKVGVLLPRSGFEAGIGQDCQRGVDVAPAILKSLNLPALTIMDADTESNVDTARARAE